MTTKLEKMGYKINSVSIYNDNPKVCVKKNTDDIKVEFEIYINRNQIFCVLNTNEDGLEELSTLTTDEENTELEQDYYNDLRLMVKHFIQSNCQQVFNIYRFKVGEKEIY